MPRRDSEALLYSQGHGRSEEETDSEDEDEEASAPKTSGRPLLLLVVVLLVVVGAGGIVYLLWSRGSSGSASQSSEDVSATSIASLEPLDGGATTVQKSSGVGSSSPSASTTSPTDVSAISATSRTSIDVSAPTEIPSSGGSGIAAQLAASFSLTPASMASLPFPTAEISSSSKAMDYIEQNWAKVQGDSGFVSFVSDPFASSASGEKVLAVEYPVGHYAGDGPAGGISGAVLKVFGSDTTVQRALLSYEVAFSEGFEWVKGGKLPGLFGGDHKDGCSGGQQSDRCFSLRLMWRAEGAGEVYAYVPRYDSFCDSKMECNEVYGISVNRGSSTFESGKWNTVTELAILNSDPSEGTTKANGMLSMYIGDSAEPVFSRSNVVFRTNADVTCTALFLSSFFGGSSEGFASKGGTAYFRNFQFFAGPSASVGDGEMVRAAVPS